MKRHTKGASGAGGNERGDERSDDEGADTRTGGVDGAEPHHSSEEVSFS